VLKQNILSLTDLVLETDLEAFLRLTVEGETAQSAGRDREALSLCQQAEDLFAGEFLPDCMYHDWSRDRRDTINSRYIEMMTRKARLHESKSAFRRAAQCYERIIALDPTHEDSYQGLMLLYSSRGQTEAAIKAYKTCRDNLARYLDITPNQTTLALYKKITK
jgi:DNA-binding SARP family transcriptional activator